VEDLTSCSNCWAHGPRCRCSWEYPVDRVYDCCPTSVSPTDSAIHRDDRHWCSQCHCPRARSPRHSRCPTGSEMGISERLKKRNLRSIDNLPQCCHYCDSLGVALESYGPADRRDPPPHWNLDLAYVMSVFWCSVNGYIKSLYLFIFGSQKKKI